VGIAFAIPSDTVKTVSRSSRTKARDPRLIGVQSPVTPEIAESLGLKPRKRPGGRTAGRGPAPKPASSP